MYKLFVTLPLQSKRDMLNKLLTETKGNRKQLLLLLSYTILTAFFCSKMSPFYPIQEWSDINLYFNVGKAIMHGQTLYTEAFDHKGPIIFLIYGIAYLISSDTFFGMFVIQSMAWVILIFSVYLSARFVLNKTYSLLVSVAFLPIFLSHTMEGGSAEEFITVFIAISLYLFIRYFRNPLEHKPSHMYIHGLMWGLVFFTKFNLVIFWVFPLLAIGLLLIIQRQYKNLLCNVLTFILGAFSVALPILMYFVIKNALNEAYDIYILLNTGRVEALSTITGNITIRFYQRLRFETLEFSIILLGACAFPFLFFRSYIAKLAITLSFLSLFAIIFMSTGYVYYYSIPYYIYAGLGLIVIAYFLQKKMNLKDSWYITLLILTIGLSSSIYRKSFFSKFSNNDNENAVRAFVPILKEDKDATLLNLGLDNANAVFTYADIMPNVQYFLSPNFTYDAYPTMRDEQTRYIENKTTKYVILTTYSINYQYFDSLPALGNNYAIIDSCKENFPWVNDDRTYYLYKRKEK